MKNYRPRRASKKWSKDAPEYVLACYDMDGVADRYTILFGGSLWNEDMGRNVQYLALNDCPTHPAMGFSQWGEMPAHNRGCLGKKIKWNDLPDNVREGRKIVSRFNSERI